MKLLVLCTKCAVIVRVDFKPGEVDRQEVHCDKCGAIVAVIVGDK